VELNQQESIRGFGMLTAFYNDVDPKFIKHLGSIIDSIREYLAAMAGKDMAEELVNVLPLGLGPFELDTELKCVPLPPPHHA
jgi:hypothetical protein